MPCCWSNIDLLCEAKSIYTCSNSMCTSTIFNHVFPHVLPYTPTHTTDHEVVRRVFVLLRVCCTRFIAHHPHHHHRELPSYAQLLTSTSLPDSALLFCGTAMRIHIAACKCLSVPAVAESVSVAFHVVTVAGDDLLAMVRCCDPHNLHRGGEALVPDEARGRGGVPHYCKLE